MDIETNTSHVDPDIEVVAISGKMNISGALVLLENSIKGMIAAGARKLAIDLSSLDSIDSSGIGLLVCCTGEIEQVGGQMRIAGAHGPVARALNVAHLDRLTPIDPDLESACRHLSAGSAVV